MIHIRLHPNNINRNSGLEFPEVWMPTIKKQQNEKFCGFLSLKVRVMHHFSAVVDRS